MIIAEYKGLVAKRTNISRLIIFYHNSKPVIGMWRRDWKRISDAIIKRMLGGYYEPDFDKKYGIGRWEHVTKLFGGV